MLGPWLRVLVWRCSCLLIDYKGGYNRLFDVDFLRLNILTILDKLWIYRLNVRLIDDYIIISSISVDRVNRYIYKWLIVRIL